MQEFFKSKLFKILLIVAASLSGLMVFEISTNHQMFLKNAIVTIAKPICNLTTGVNSAVVGFFDEFFRSGFYKEKNELLEKEIAITRKKLIDFEQIKKENEQLRQFVNIKNSNKNFEVEMATIIAKNPEDFCEFTVDIGYEKGIEDGAAVITEKGLVGIVTQTSKKTSKITTILGINVQVPAIDLAKDEKGIVCGEPNLNNESLCKMLHLSKATKCEVGDVITTSGNKDTFPKNIIIGNIKDIEVSPNGISSIAIIETAEDLNSIKDVLIVKNSK